MVLIVLIQRTGRLIEDQYRRAADQRLRQAYALARRHFDDRAVNRVILATDGDFNVGITDPEELTSFVERKRDTGVYLSVLGFGMGNYKDSLMEQLADKGDGNYAYVDSMDEAKKIFGTSEIKDCWCC